jgi:hypothetical protein
MPKMPAVEWEGQLFYIGFIDAINFYSMPKLDAQNVLSKQF